MSGELREALAKHGIGLGTCTHPAYWGGGQDGFIRDNFSLVGPETSAFWERVRPEREKPFNWAEVLEIRGKFPGQDYFTTPGFWPGMFLPRWVAGLPATERAAAIGEFNRSMFECVEMDYAVAINEGWDELGNQRTTDVEVRAALKSAGRYAGRRRVLVNQHLLSKRFVKRVMDWRTQGRVDMVGWQAHLSVGGPVNEGVEGQILAFRELARQCKKRRMKVAITELDVCVYQARDKEAVRAGWMARIVKEAVKCGICEFISFWGAHDGVSWKKAFTPLAWDRNMQPKAAYWAMVDMAKKTKAVPALGDNQ